MTWKQITLVPLLALVAAGCVRSLHKLYTEKDLVFRQELVGMWREEGEMNTWTFRKWKDSAYQLRYFEAGERSADSLPHSVLGDTALFDVHLVELRGNLFMDLYPNQPAVRTDLCLIHMLPVHTFWKVTMKDREVEIAMLNQEWLDKMVEEGKVKIQHERVNDEVILTAPTGDLQKLVSAFADDPRAFPEPAVLRKVAD